MRILYLYNEVMGYTIATLKELAKNSCELHVIRKDQNKSTPFTPPCDIPSITFYLRSELNYFSMNQLFLKVRPDVVVVSGWNDYGYLEVARLARKRNTPVVLCLDGQWKGTFKQHVGASIFKHGVLRLLFSHAWVAGPYQFEYAKRFGFKNENVIFDVLSADTPFLQSEKVKNRQVKSLSKLTKNILFVGRFAEEKDLEFLIRVWQKLALWEDGWRLTLVGKGDFLPDLKAVKSVKVKEFLTQAELVIEASNADFFVLPSKSEAWGVVVHEFASLSMPLLLSTKVGARASFLIDGKNGFSFVSGSEASLSRALTNATSLDYSEVKAMGCLSRELANRISPASSAFNLLSIVRH